MEALVRMKQQRTQQSTISSRTLYEMTRRKKSMIAQRILRHRIHVTDFAQLRLRT